MQIGRARESWQINHKALARFMDLPALACTSNLHEPHQNKNHSLSELVLCKLRMYLKLVVKRCWPFQIDIRQFTVDVFVAGKSFVELCEFLLVFLLFKLDSFVVSMLVDMQREEKRLSINIIYIS